MAPFRHRLRSARLAYAGLRGRLLRLSARRAVVLLAALFLSLLAAGDGVLLSLQYDRSLEEAGQEAANLTIVLEKYVWQSLQNLDTLLRNIADAFGTGNAGPSARDGFVFRRTLLAEDLRVYGRDGRLMRSILAPGSGAKDWSQNESFLYLRDHKESAPFVGAPFKEDGLWRHPISLRISGRDGTFAGIAVAMVNLDTFATFFRSIDVGKHGIVSVIRRDGQIIARYPQLPDSAPHSLGRSPMFRQQVAPLSQGMVQGLSYLDGVERIGHFRAVEGQPLVVAVMVLKADALASWWGLVELHAGILAAVALAVALLVALIYRQQGNLAAAAAAVREEQRRLEAITTHLPAALLQRIQPPGAAARFTYLSSGGEAVLGIPRDELLANPQMLTHRVVPEDRQAVLEALDRSAATMTDFSEEFRVEVPGGDIRWLRGSARPRWAEGGTIVWDGLIVDVSAHKAAMADKRILERRLEAIMGKVPGVVFQRVLDRTGAVRYTFVSPQVHALFGVTADEVIRDYRVMMDRALPEDRNSVEDSFDRQGADHTEWIKEFRVTGLDGQVRWVRGTATRHRSESGEIVWDGILLDVTMQKAAVAATRALQRRMEAVVANTPGVVFECMQTREGLRFSFVSPQIERMFGLPIRAALYDYQRIKADIVPEDKALLDIPPLRLGDDAAEWAGEFRVQPKGEALRWIRGTARARRTDDATVIWNGVFQDITQAKLGEEQTQRAQRNEALAHLTAGVAHEFNNLLTVIQGNLELLEIGAGPTRELIAGSQRAAERGARVTRALQAYARRQSLRPRTGRFNEMLQEVIVLLHSILGQGVQLDLRLAERTWPVHVDWDQLGNALIALAVKGKEAMPRGGVLRVQAANETVTEPRGDIPRGDYVRLTVTDTGQAMAEDARRHAFDPFYSPATVGGGGVDLGLSALFGFVRQSHGYVSLESDEGRGTTVSILLPRAGVPESAPAGRAAIA